MLLSVGTKPWQEGFKSIIWLIVLPIYTTLIQGIWVIYHLRRYWSGSKATAKEKPREIKRMEQMGPRYLLPFKWSLFLTFLKPNSREPFGGDGSDELFCSVYPSIHILLGQWVVCFEVSVLYEWVYDGSRPQVAVLLWSNCCEVPHNGTFQTCHHIAFSFPPSFFLPFSLFP